MPEVFTSKWHVKLLRPAICEKPACMVYEIFDAMSPNPKTTLVVAAISFTCTGHTVATNAGKGTLRWMDGNFKDLAAYIDYQKQYFFYINNQEWQTRVANGDIPRPWNRPSMTLEAILQAQKMPTVNFRGVSTPLTNWGTEPPTTGTVVRPTQAEIDDLDRVYAWVMQHDDWMSTALGAMRQELNVSTEEELKQFDSMVSWHFEGTGDTRLLYVDSGRQLSNQERTRIESALDIQFGPDKVVVEG